MCTVTFIPRANGYLLGMNRDEKIARGAGNPPAVHRFGGTRAVCPDDNGGTWIASNEYGITLALLNWNLPSAQQTPRRSRGLIIPDLLPLTNAAELNTASLTYEFVGCAPFRLLAAIPGDRSVLQWSWDGAQLTRRASAWEMRHWFSSSASDKRAEELRGEICARAAHYRNTGSAAWLRRLHRSHENGPAAFSVCVHRELVATLSYTEIFCGRDKISMMHAIGKPCEPRETHSIELRRRHSRVSAPLLVQQQATEESNVCRF
jgi:hypothetical protein